MKESLRETAKHINFHSFITADTENIDRRTLVRVIERFVLCCCPRPCRPFKVRQDESSADASRWGYRYLSSASARRGFLLLLLKRMWWCHTIYSLMPPGVRKLMPRLFEWHTTAAAASSGKLPDGSRNWKAFHQDAHHASGLSSLN